MARILPPQNGYSLLEVMIAVFVTALGFLAVAALQAQSLMSGQEGILRTQASAIADDLAARIRGNREASSAAGLDNYLAQYAGAPYQCNGSYASKNCRAGAGAETSTCSSAEVIAFDRFEACTDALTKLPDGEIRSVVTGQRLSIGVAWTAAAVASGRGVQQAANSDAQCALLQFSSAHNCVVLELVP